MKAHHKNTSLLITTYNFPEALNLCLQSVRKQTVLPKEVIIADDGSKEETKKLIEGFQENFPVPLIHVWQEDLGFRVAAIRNKGIMKCTGDYIIQIDGDIILHPQFVEDHLALSEKGTFLRGGRAYIDRKRTEEFFRSGILPELSFFSRGVTHRTYAIYCMRISKYIKKIYRKNNPRVLGVNLSFWKEDFLKVNGYDEFFEGWGREDCDFGFRLIHAGVKKLSIKFSAIVFHLWHEHNSMENLKKNQEYSLKLKERNTYMASKGVSQYLHNEE